MSEETATGLIAAAERCMADKDLFGALAALTKAIMADSACAEAYRLRGELLMAMGDTAGAQADAMEALRLDPQIMCGVDGSFTADGKEKCVQKPTSVLNPLGL